MMPMMARTVCWTLLGAGTVWPQAAASPSFDVVSVKPGRPVAGDAIFCENGRLTVYSQTFRTLLQIGWNVRDIQIVGGPAWIDSDPWYISAKGDPSSTDSQCRIMVQNLLKDRFRLVVHDDMKDLPVYALVLTKAGPKFHESPPDAGPNMKVGKARLDVQRVSMANVARLLSTIADRPVMDKTGLAGKYTFTVEWNADDSAVEGTTEEKPSAAATASLLAALESKLGLRLEVQKGPVSVVVIDEVERPSPN